MKQLIIDPPEGWRYGFPRPVPIEYFEKDFDKTKWLLSVGYPQKLIDEFPGGIPCRYWEI